MLKIDSYTHILTPKYMAGLSKRSVQEFTPAMYDLDSRFRIMDRHPEVVQVLVPGGGALEVMADPKRTAELAKVGNDELAELVSKYPDRFVGAVAILPMNNVDASLKEADRAIRELHFRGVFIRSPVNGKPLDSPEFLPLYEKMAQYNLPIVIHPARDATTPDYPGEERSRYRMGAVWGWPYETTLAMTRLVFSGVFDRFPDIKFVTHHAGAMVPYFASRITGYWDMAEAFNKDKDKLGLTRPLVDYFRLFYNDTALYGNTPGLMCAYAFFGAEHLLFGTDFPWDSQHGARLTRDTIEAVDGMDIPQVDKRKIYQENARRLFRLPV